MQLVGSRSQQQQDDMYDFSGTITTAGTAQLLLPQAKSRSLFIFSNTSANVMSIQFGIRPSTATLTSGAVSAVTLVDAGQLFWLPPLVEFLGGGAAGAPGFAGATAPDWPAPNNPATGHAVMSGAAGSQTISSISIDFAGSGYLVVPYVLVKAQPGDPTGVGALGATTAGIQIAANSTLQLNGTCCPTSAAVVFCGTSASTFTCKTMP
jgi:hypothetical protein